MKNKPPIQRRRPRTAPPAAGSALGASTAARHSATSPLVIARKLVSISYLRRRERRRRAAARHEASTPAASSSCAEMRCARAGRRRTASEMSATKHGITERSASRSSAYRAAQLSRPCTRTHSSKAPCGCCGSSVLRCHWMSGSRGLSERASCPCTCCTASVSTSAAVQGSAASRSAPLSHRPSSERTKRCSCPSASIQTSFRMIRCRRATCSREGAQYLATCRCGTTPTAAAGGPSRTRRRVSATARMSATPSERPRRTHAAARCSRLRLD
mmetsp:Transcript_28759/g.92479  ORF Transcript_28759/g.92479 Transcript_28759/m.92479 type:complete len:272 (+) Transcript_28759:115-930(+)